ncbi:MAG: deoxyribodipyrimidine photo-lyase [Bacteroidetes bacterium]|nr:deoxyribodipyrimidine photo-lyase [Bacteroidota bacterium]
MNKIAVFWFRRDLRLHDNAALYHALRSGYTVLPIFIFDTDILNKLPSKHDRRVDFIQQTLVRLNEELKRHGSSLLVLHGSPQAVYTELLKTHAIAAVYANHDYEPLARQRDLQIETLLTSHHAAFHTYKDQCIFEKDEVTKDDGRPYTIFTPYSRKWKQTLTDFYVKPYPVEAYTGAFQKDTSRKIPSLKEIGFEKTDLVIPPASVPEKIVKHYREQRDFPAIQGTSRLSVHLRFGTVSIRELVRAALKLNETWLNELIWRDFYMMILHHFPHVEKQAFKPAYDKIVWRNNESEFTRWCQGQTGFPIVDAGMRELQATGFMHNRVRMIVASFLIKDLLIDWRWGEAYFAEKLLDFDLSANNGGWQWAASSGCDAAPYFRIFNPLEQTKKFDPGMDYIKRWVPEYGTPAYPLPMVDHAAARLRTLRAYKDALDESKQISLF